jgi:hypothetical protein
MLSRGCVQSINVGFHYFLLCIFMYCLQLCFSVASSWYTQCEDFNLIFFFKILIMPGNGCSQKSEIREFRLYTYILIFLCSICPRSISEVCLDPGFVTLTENGIVSESYLLHSTLYVCFYVILLYDWISCQKFSLRLQPLLIILFFIFYGMTPIWSSLCKRTFLQDKMLEFMKFMKSYLSRRLCVNVVLC